MLSFLKVENLAVIESLSLDFEPGFTVLTGETGAGKSIIVDAVGLLLGERGDAALVRSGCEKLTVEGLFEMKERSPVADLIRSLGVDVGAEGIVLRREVTASGRTRAFVNGTLVTLQQLRSIGDHLADLHGQHQHQSLLGADGQREALDRFGALAGTAAEVAGAAPDLRGLLAERESLRATERERARREDALRAEIGEIRGAAPAVDEEAALRREAALLRHAEEVATLAEETCHLLNEDDASVLSRLGAVRERLARLAAIDERAGEALRAAEEARLGLKEALREVERYREPADFEAGRIDQVAARLATLDRLKRKYGPAIEDVLAYLARAEAELADLGGAAGRLEGIEAEVEAAARRYAGAAARLSRGRREAARRLEAAMRRELAPLAMAGCRVEVALEPREDADGEVVVDGRRVRCRGDGVESIEFRIAPNPGEDLRPLARVASGGELSRLMLALRTAAEARGADARTLVFDEVDSGIGGAVAEAVGQRLAGLARRQQVLCVTHLPQIAALADRHVRVEKVVAGGRTSAVATVVEKGERVEEVARMLGAPQAPTARRHAAALINGRKP